jgi:hypothetical protein
VHHSLAIKLGQSFGPFRGPDTPSFSVVRAIGGGELREAGAGITLKRSVAAGLLLGSAALLGACSPFSSSLADMWPHWAGGEPAGLPPRPGQPGYEEFIAHGQPNQNPAATPAAAQQAPGGTTAAIAEQKSVAQAPAVAEPRPQHNGEAEPAAEAVEHPISDTGVVRGGGLY